MRYFHGNHKKNAYFEGWYFKHQDSKNTISFIPGVQMDKNCCATSFIQVIMENKSHYFTFPISRFHADSKRLYIKIGRNIFTDHGIHIDIHQKDEQGEYVRLKGYFFYGKINPLKYSIMGPLSSLPIPCKHGIISMRHMVYGKIIYNDSSFQMEDGIGYMETDYGHSFPQDYFWTQFNSPYKDDLQIVGAVATIPFGSHLVLGSFAVIRYGGKQYRLATYLGAKVLIIRENLAIIAQGSYVLVIHAKKHLGQQLKAPQEGKMKRTVMEDLDGTIRYEFYRGQKKIFDVTANRAGFEYMTKS